MDLLIFTKSTRLSMTPGLMEEIKSWPIERKMEEIIYISQTIPSSWEFCIFVFLIENVSRAFTHQAVRTRNASYAQQTMRVLDMADFAYVFTDRNLDNPEAVQTILKHKEYTSACYRKLIELGQAPEDARGILPTNIATNIVAQYNLRTLSELAKSRTGGRTQGEYIKVVNAMIDQVLAVQPWAEHFLTPKGRDLFKEIEDFAEMEFGGDLLKKGKLLKIVDVLRKELT
jgi:flavin-dependent thymidylate synthase